MAQLRKHVLLLFGGGTSLIQSDGAVSVVRSPKDVLGWMKSATEVNIIAQLQPKFLYSGASFDEQPQWWQRIATEIAAHYKEYDGFIVTQPVDAIPYTAAALTVMLSRIGKPVVITGSPELPAGRITKKMLKAWYGSSEIGIRANLVGAAQVATLDIGEVSVLFGNCLLRGANVIHHNEPSLNMFESAGVAPLGRVDFGLKLEPHRRHRAATVPKLLTTLKTRILQIPLGPTTAQAMAPSIKPGTLDGVLVSGDPSATPADVLDKILAAIPSDIPVAVYAERTVQPSPRYFTIMSVTPAMALVTFMWALGQTSSPKKLQQLLSTVSNGARALPKPPTP